MSDAGKNGGLDRDHALELLSTMVLVRRFEDKCAELYSATKIRGFLHLYNGEEAVGVGAMQVLRAEDAIVATYREHGQAIARGIDPKRIMAELYGKREGCSGGRGGSMHIFDADTRFYGGYAIVGGGLPLAVGLALADRLQGNERVTACFFGEGAVAEGEFHESMNLAALWQLPVLFLCENNLYAMGTRLDLSESQIDMHAKASCYDVTSDTVDGMDVVAVEEAVRTAADAVRAGEGPGFLECRTYRFRAHSMFDAQRYREKSEVEDWKQRGPIVTFVDRLKRAGLADDDDVAAIEREADRRVEEAVAFAESGTWEPVEQLTRNVYTEPEAS